MTKHAIDRIKERFPDDSPDDVLELIGSCIASGQGHNIAMGLQGETIREVWLPRARSLFAVIGRDGNVLTVLSPGMTTPTDMGVVTLERTSLAPGVYVLPEARYHADPCAIPSLSSTIAKKLAYQSPAHAHHAMHHNKTSKAFDIGTAAHSLVLGKGAEMVEVPDRLLGKGGAMNTTAAKDFAAEQRAAGRVPLKPDDFIKVCELAEVMRMFIASCGLTIEPGRTEVTAIAEVDGVLCRMMGDSIPTDPSAPILDIKTTTDASLDAVTRAIDKFRYDVSDSHYRETWKAATGEDREFLFAFIESEPPFGARLTRIKPMDREMAARKTRRAREVWVRCQSTQSWPGYPAGLFDIELPTWNSKSWLAQEDITEAIEGPSRAALQAAQRAQAPVRVINGDMA